MNIYEKVAAIQQKLKAPKGQYNSFGKYKYRSCEDILEAVKPLVAENKLSMLISDHIEYIEGRWYVCATVTIINAENPEEKIINTAYAREEESKKGMDGAQVTGATSSYARKYALNGTFAIDDTRDPDTDEFHMEQQTRKPKITCPQCGKEIRPTKDKAGIIRQPEEILNLCGGVCIECFKQNNK